MNVVALPTWQDLRNFYNLLTLHIVPGPRSPSYFLPFALTILALLTPPSLLPRRLIQYVLLPLIYAVQLHVWTTHKSFDVISMNMALTSFMLLGWHDIRLDFRHVRRADSSIRASSKTERNDQEKRLETDGTLLHRQEASFHLEAYPKRLVSRIGWVFMLLSSMRLTDWHIGMMSHDVKQPVQVKPLSVFVRETLVQILIAVVLVDFTSPYMQGLACNYVTLDMSHSSIFSRGVGSLVLLAHCYAVLALGLALLPYLISIVPLFLVPRMRSNSIASPLTWPSLFGPLSSVFSHSAGSQSPKLGLRAFWGVFWHQNMRYITSTPGVALASFLNLKRGSKVRYMLIVASGFFWSGVVHMGVIPPEPIGTTLSSWQMRLRLASFFWLQVLGILVEEGMSSFIDFSGSGTRPQDQMEVAESGPRRSRDYSSSFHGPTSTYIVRSLILAWTVIFLGVSAWCTILPVGCEMGWFNVRLAPGVYHYYWMP